MSHSPANGKGGASTSRMSVPPASGSAPARTSMDKGAARGLTPEQQKKVVILSAALVVLLAFLGLYVYFNYLKTPAYAEPPLNGSDLEKVKFVGTAKFDQLSFERWMIWVQTVADKKKEMTELYRAGSITRDEMVQIASVAWVAKEYKQMNQYYARTSPIARKAYLQDLVGKDLKDDVEDKAKPEDPSAAKRDKKKCAAMIEKFPSKERQEYDAFLQAYKEVEKQMEKDRKAQKKAEQATRPTTRAATTQPAAKPVQ